MKKIAELYGHGAGTEQDWKVIIREQQCPYLGRKCLKNRKSEPNQTIGSCTVQHSRIPQPIMICPHRLLQGNKIFFDCLHLLTLHEPGNELRINSEITIPGGSVDYFLVSLNGEKICDFVGIELQTLDSTGTVWPHRQRFAKSKGVRTKSADVEASKSFGMNWKMTAKTILVQLNHKIETFEHINKHLVLVVQDCLLDYIQGNFSGDHIEAARLGDPMHFHSYRMSQAEHEFDIKLDRRLSTDCEGVQRMLGLQSESKVELEMIVKQIQEKLPKGRALQIGGDLA